MRNPIKVLIINESNTAKTTFIPIFTIKYAQTMLTKEIIDPVARSIPPSRITYVMPTDAMPKMDTCFATFSKFFTVRKFGLIIVKKMTISTRKA